MNTPLEIISQAIDHYKPIKALLLFSGGHDSLVSTHVAASILKEMNLDFYVYHGDTTIKIPETQQFVKYVCSMFDWPLIIASPPNEKDSYESIVTKYGFPGPSLQSHQFMYRRLKERALNHTITHVIKTSPHSRENVLLISGVRKFESRVRMGYIDHTRKENSKIWCNPLFWWEKSTCEKYMADNNLPRNRVKDVIGISGECLCGCFADKGEFDLICQHYPEVADEIDRLYEIAKEHGHNWFWTQGPTAWVPENNSIFDENTLGMCIRCANRSINK